MEQPLRILMLEDEPRDAGLAERELRKAGLQFTAERVETEAAFVAAIEASAPDLILADYTLPHFDGLSALAIVREQRPDTPFILISGTLGEERAIEALKAGVTDYVLKDRIERLGPVVQRALKEAEGQRARRRAEEHIRKLSRAVEQSSASVIITDTRGDIEYVNTRFTEVTGYTLEEVAGKNPRILKSGETPPEEYRRLWETVAAGRPWRGEFLNRRKNGEVYWDNVLISPLKNAEGIVTHYVANQEDITHIVSRMREFYRQREDEELLLPVNLNEMANQVLELTRPRWRDMPQERGVVVETETDLQDAVPSILGVEAEIHEALTNLIFNAVDAMPQGGRLVIKTRMEQGSKGAEEQVETAPPPLRPSAAVLEVSDTGVGMDAETRQRCLEPFYSTKKEKGTGLGLAMVFGTVKRHKGGIEVDSEPGRGTTMRLIFPVRRDGGQSEARSEALDRYTGPSLRLLCIDDDPDVLEVVRRLLEKDGHAVTAADGGQAGLDAFRTALAGGAPFDVVFTDLGMPYVDGREVTRTVKRESPATLVILLTGWGRSLIFEDDIPAGADAVLSKPPEVPDLRRVIMQVCGKK